MDEQCKHDHWEVRGSDDIGCGTCLDCGASVRLDILFNRLRERMEEAIERARNGSPTVSAKPVRF